MLLTRLMPVRRSRDYLFNRGLGPALFFSDDADPGNLIGEGTNTKKGLVIPEGHGFAFGYYAVEVGEIIHLPIIAYLCQVTYYYLEHIT